MFALKWKCINIHSFSPLPLLSVYIVIDKKKKKKKPKQRKCLIAVAFVTFEQSMGVIIFIANDSCGFFMPSPSATSSSSHPTNQCSLYSRGLGLRPLFPLTVGNVACVRWKVEPK